jgi:hypothetical protein
MSAYSFGQLSAFYGKLYVALAKKAMICRCSKVTGGLQYILEECRIVLGILVVIVPIRLFAVFIAPFISSHGGHTTAGKLTGVCEVIGFSYSGRESYLKLLLKKLQSVVSNASIFSLSESVDWNMFTFVMSILAALVPMAFSVIGASGDKYPLCFSPNNCLTVPGNGSCNVRHVCSESDFSTTCSTYNLPLKFFSDRCELENFSTPVVRGGRDCLLSAAVTSLPYSNYKRFWLETGLYISFFAACILFWLYEWGEKFCFKIAYMNGCTYDPNISTQTFAAFWSGLLDSWSSSYELVCDPLQLILCYMLRYKRFLSRF